LSFAFCSGYFSQGKLFGFFFFDTFEILKQNLHKVNNRPIGENSPDLVTLISAHGQPPARVSAMIAIELPVNEIRRRRNSDHFPMGEFRDGLR
jgi:hypothetical protein